MQRSEIGTGGSGSDEAKILRAIEEFCQVNGLVEVERTDGGGFDLVVDRMSYGGGTAAEKYVHFDVMDDIAFTGNSLVRFGERFSEILEEIIEDPEFRTVEGK